MKVSASENWLLDIGQADHAQHCIFNLNGLTVDQVQAAFDVQYGPGEFKVTSHGTVITVISYPGYVREQIAKGESKAHIGARLERIGYKIS